MTEAKEVGVWDRDFTYKCPDCGGNLEFKTDSLGCKKCGKSWRYPEEGAE